MFDSLFRYKTGWGMIVWVILGLLSLSYWLVGCTLETSPVTTEEPYLINTSSVPGAPEKVKIGIVVLLTGGAAEPFGIPARNGAEAMLEALNRGEAPAPYQQPGIAGVPIAALFVDESGGPQKQVEELRRLFLEEEVDLVIGYISSADCLAVAPVAEELQELTIAFDCGTSRLFEERSYRYVFRTNAHQAIDSLGGARYLLTVRPDLVSVAGINQNYAWGQDSWSHFRNTLLALKPDIQIVSEQFPKFEAGEYTAELAELRRLQPEVIHSSFWGADLKTLLVQAKSSSVLNTSTFLFSVGEYALPILGDQIPAQTILGAHGPHGAMAPSGELKDWLLEIYQPRYGQRPTYPVYHMSQALLGIKMAYEKAIDQHGVWPTREQVIAAFEYLEFPTPSGVIRMSIGKGHQAVEPAVFGIAGEFDPVLGENRILQPIVFPPECVNPPEGTTTEQWIREGFPGATCP